VRIMEKEQIIIEDAVQSTEIEKTGVTPGEHSHLQKVCAELEQARGNFHQAQQVIAQAQSNLAAAEGAQASFLNYLVTVYQLTPVDSIDITTGKFKRAQV
jgi:hypothetical protein